MCGIFGIVSRKRIDFDKVAFNVLGCMNDLRGGDSCGVFIDKKVEIGFAKTELYSDFMEESKVVNNTSKALIALGHCRKASVGGVTFKAAQPVYLGPEIGAIDFCLIHNGTLYNYEELAAKYIPKVDIKGLTDSQVLARIIYHAGYDVLGEYYGGAAIVTVDYRGNDKKPITRFFKGASFNREFDVEASVERPLTFVEDDERLIFSSIPETLQPFRKERKVFAFKSNILYAFTSEKGLHHERAINRSKVGQYKNLYYSNNVVNFGNVMNKRVGFEWIKKTESKTCKMAPDGKYMIGEDVCNGIYKLNSYGSTFGGKAKKYAFFEGLLMKNIECYNYVKNVLTKTRKGLSKEDYDEVDLIILSLAYYPIIEEDGNGGLIFYTVDPETLKVELFTGELAPLFDFSTIVYTIKTGSHILSETTYKGSDDRIKTYLKEGKEFVINKNHFKNL